MLSMGPIKILPQKIISQIAAGEVIERPSSVVKELIENALDAGATEITVKIIDGGKNFISVSDNGSGMDKQSLGLCTMSHATSKLASEDLFDIHTFGFRGEALPSISSVARLSIITSDNNIGEAWQLRIDDGHANNFNIAPANRSRGTTIEARDLFFATPARLKFLKSETYEAEKCKIIFDNLSMANCGVSFRFIDSEREKAYYEKANTLSKRIEDIFGKSFSKNIFELRGKRENFNLYGYISIPTFNKSTSTYQYFFVNGRLVKDKTFATALKSAYAGLIPHGRYPAAILCLSMPCDEVDVNVHPAKTEVKFKENNKIREFITFELKHALQSSNGSCCSTTDIIDRFYSSMKNSLKTVSAGTFSNSSSAASLKTIVTTVHKPKKSTEQVPKIADVFTFPVKKFKIFEQTSEVKKSEDKFSLELPETMKTSEKVSFGRAMFQINNTYIVAENNGNIIIIDQHAAAERIMLEELKNNQKISSQNLLIPEEITFTEAQIELLKQYNDILLKTGIHLEYTNKNSAYITAVPVLLEATDSKLLLNDIVEELSAFGDTCILEDKLHNILSTISCHSSLRAGKRLSKEEMNCLLQKMELSTNIAQCCHGRPSYVTVTFKDINNFFQRS